MHNICIVSLIILEKVSININTKSLIILEKVSININTKSLTSNTASNVLVIDADLGISYLFI